MADKKMSKNITMHSQQSHVLPKQPFTKASYRPRHYIGDRYAASNVVFYCGHAALEEVWQQLLASSISPEKIYQTRAYFEHVHETQANENAYGLIVLYDTDERIVGILPVRECRQELQFQIGFLCVCKYSFKVLQVLGSVPLLRNDEPGLLEFAFKNLLQRYPGCRGLVMQAIPSDIIDEYENLNDLAHHVLHGWRECHVYALPDTVELYLQRFSAKKRYNLSRQVRVLAQSFGEVQLIRVTEVDEVSGFIEGLESIPVACSHLTPNLERDLKSLATNGLIACYLLKAGDQVAAAILGKRSDDVWHIHNIYYKEEFAHLSVGTSILHLAQQDVIKNLPIRRVDFGYGTPSQESRSHHSLEKRGKILVCDKTGSLDLILKIWASFDRLNQRLCERVKRMKK